jgi:hypothetical protein
VKCERGAEYMVDQIKRLLSIWTARQRIPYPLGSRARFLLVQRQEAQTLFFLEDFSEQSHQHDEHDGSA